MVWDSRKRGGQKVTIQYPGALYHVINRSITITGEISSLTWARPMRS